MSEVIVLIPAYNPTIELKKLVKKLKKDNFPIVIINDGSDKEYYDMFNDLSSENTVISYEENRGKGFAIKTGLKYILDKFPDYLGVITVDGYGQHSINDIIHLSSKIYEEEHSLIIGSRNFTGNIPLKIKFGNTITKKIFQIASGIKINDTQTGLRAFGMELVPFLLTISGDRYEYETNVLLECIKNNIIINEVNIETIYMDNNDTSHFRPIQDSLRIYSCLLKYKFNFINNCFVYGKDISIENFLKRRE